MCASLNKANERNLADNLLTWIRRLKITSGDHLGEPVTVLPWQERFIRGTFRPGVQTSGLSVGRGNGKTTVVSWLAAAVLFGPLCHRNAKVVIACASHEQGGTIHKAVCDLLPDRQTTSRWSVWDSNRLKIKDRETGAELVVMSFSPGASHGIMGASLILADEVAQWQRTKIDKMWTALEGTLGKSPGCRLVGLGTRPASKDNPFSKLLDGQADFAVEYRSRAKKYWFRESAIRQANPSLDHFPALRDAIERDARIARTDEAKLAAFMAYRLNQGTEESEVKNAVISARVYAPLESEEVEIDALYVLGIDLSGGHAQTGVSAVSMHPGPDGKHGVDAFAAWPTSANLKERSERDGVDYNVMVRDGDLLILPGPSVAVDQVVGEAIARWGRPAVVVSDYFRITESRWCLEQLGYIEKEDLIYRRAGWFDGAEDVRLFRRMVAEKSLAIRRSGLLRQSFASARTLSDQSGNEKIAKETERSNRGKDDAAAAVVIATAEVHRRQLIPSEVGGFQVVHVPAW